MLQIVQGGSKARQMEVEGYEPRPQEFFESCHDPGTAPSPPPRKNAVNGAVLLTPRNPPPRGYEHYCFFFPTIILNGKGLSGKDVLKSFIYLGIRGSVSCVPIASSVLVVDGNKKWFSAFIFGINVHCYFFCVCN